MVACSDSAQSLETTHLELLSEHEALKLQLQRIKAQTNQALEEFKQEGWSKEAELARELRRVKGEYDDLKNGTGRVENELRTQMQEVICHH